MLKFRLSEKRTKFEINLPHAFDKSDDLLRKGQNHEEDFFKPCVLLKKSEFYHESLENGNNRNLEKDLAIFCRQYKNLWIFY